jgi:hypothetical protein
MGTISAALFSLPPAERAWAVSQISATFGGKATKLTPKPKGEKLPWKLEWEATPEFKTWSGMKSKAKGVEPSTFQAAQSAAFRVRDEIKSHLAAQKGSESSSSSSSSSATKPRKEKDDEEFSLKRAGFGIPHIEEEKKREQLPPFAPAPIIGDSLAAIIAANTPAKLDPPPAKPENGVREKPSPPAQQRKH